MKLATASVMAGRDVVVIGASSGGVAAITELVAGLPAEFPAAVFIVLHLGESSRSRLPEILNRAGRLPAAHAVHDEPIRRGRIYVAPPGLQMYVGQDRLRVVRGPVENLHRPSIDALFRTAAHYFGPRVVGVVLSGALDDGAAGLLAIKQSAGIAIVQDPSDASMSDMPSNAMNRAGADHVARAADIPGVLTSIVGQRVATSTLPAEVPLETVEESRATGESYRSDQMGPPSFFTCPDCSGTLFEIEDGELVRYRCRVGHAFSPSALVAAQNQSTERALWAALRALEEREALMRKLAGNARRAGHDAVAMLFEGKADQVNLEVRAVHDLIVNGRALDAIPEDAEGATVP